jgi:hypothetical protein
VLESLGNATSLVIRAPAARLFEALRAAPISQMPPREPPRRAKVQLKELGNEREAAEKWSYEKLMAALHEQLSDAQIEKLAAESLEASGMRYTPDASRVLLP